jgi:hypothetical protein
MPEDQWDEHQPDQGVAILARRYAGTIDVAVRRHLPLHDAILASGRQGSPRCPPRRLMRPPAVDLLAAEHRRLRHGLRIGRPQHCGPSGLKLAVRPFRGTRSPGPWCWRGGARLLGGRRVHLISCSCAGWRFPGDDSTRHSYGVLSSPTYRFRRRHRRHRSCAQVRLRGSGSPVVRRARASQTAGKNASWMT